MSDKPLSMQEANTNPEDKFFHEPDPLAIEGGEYIPEMEKDIVLLVGAGDTAQEVARLARYAGFAVDVIDTRDAYATFERFPTARQVLLCQSYADIEKRCSITSNHYLVVATKDVESDLAALRHVLHSKARYIGVQGDEQRKEQIFAALRSDGTPAAELACICCPIGLPIGARNPAEMGIAIIAELIAARAGCLAGPRSGSRSIKKARK